jgi:hypothetical protein
VVQAGGRGLATIKEGGEDLSQNKQKDDKEAWRSVLSRSDRGRGSGICLLMMEEVKKLPTMEYCRFS